MDQQEVTIRQIAEQCGVSKSTAVRKFKELDLPVITRGGKGTVFLGPEAASLLARALSGGTVDVAPEVSPTAEPATEALPSLEPDIRDDQISLLRESNGLLRDQITQLTQMIELVKSQNESTVTVLSDQIDRLTEQVATLQREKDALRDQLAMSRALEGFHLPWQRDRIISRYLLPSPLSDPTYETE